jgi:hypothetical protein
MKGASLYPVTHLERVVCALRKQDRTGPWIASPSMPRNILTIIYMTSLIFVHLRILLVCTPSCGKHSYMHSVDHFWCRRLRGSPKNSACGRNRFGTKHPSVFRPWTKCLYTLYVKICFLHTTAQN